MIRRSALLGGAASLVARAARAQKGTMPTRERDVRFAGAGGVSLAGTLLLPAISEMQAVPGVVLIAGSGPTDRDGNNRLVPVRIDLLKQFAELLAQAGIASLRYDKRGIGASTPRPAASIQAEEVFFAWENFIGDVQTAHGELLKHSEIKPYATAFLGHSEGGLLALAALAATEARRRPYALVLASTPGLPLLDIVRAQVARTAPPFVEATAKVMAAIGATGHVPVDIAPELTLVFPPYAGAFLQKALAFDPAKVLASLDTPCLLLHGGADAQVVPLGDIQPLIDALAKRDKPGEVLVAPAVSHNLKTVSWPTDPGFAGPVAPAIADKLTGWLGQVLGA
jgi:pimeloyl-ACP methyl ester carboxylesterase